MSTAVRDLRFFHLTGARPRAELAPPEQLCPALFAGFRDLTALRYDFPLVLVDDETEFARTLTSAVDQQHSSPDPPSPEKSCAVTCRT